MDSPAVDLAHPLSVTFAGFTFDPEVTQVRLTGMRRRSFNVPHLGLAAPVNVSNMPKLFSRNVDPGQVIISGHFNPDLSPPLKEDYAAGNLTIEWNDLGTPASWLCSAGCTEFQCDSSPVEEGQMTFELTVDLAGDITITPGVT